MPSYRTIVSFVNMRLSRGQLAEHYRKNFDPNVYVDTYANERLEIEPFFCTNLFKVLDQGKVKGTRCVDIGAGPIIHRLGYASRFFDKLVHTDFLAQNMHLARQWLTTNDLDLKHRHLMKFAARLEGHKDEEEGARIIEARLRSKMDAIIPVDVLEENPIKNLAQHGGPFDCAISHGCLESVCTSYEETVKALENIGRVLKPGAALILEGFLHGDYYKVGPTTFPAWTWNSEMVVNALKEAGYQLEFIELTNKPIYYGSERIPKDMFFTLSYKKSL